MTDIKELKDKELEKVAGGYGIAKYSLNTGDTFKGNCTYVDYVMFVGPSGEYAPKDRLDFIRYFDNGGYVAKRNWNLSMNNIEGLYTYYKVCNESELDDLLLN